MSIQREAFTTCDIFQLPRTKGKWALALDLEQKIKAKQKPLTFLLNKRMNTDSKG